MRLPPKPSTHTETTEAKTTHQIACFWDDGEDLIVELEGTGFDKKIGGAATLTSYTSVAKESSATHI